MNALDALRMARDAGVRVWIDGDDLVVEAVAAPPPKVIGLLSSHKAAILRELREVASDTVPAVPVAQISQVTFQFTTPSNPANDGEALRERAAIMAVENGWNETTALQEARWTLDRERCWRAFLLNAERVLAAPGAPKREAMLVIYKAEAIHRYGESTGTDMALSLASWVWARRVH